LSPNISWNVPETSFTLLSQFLQFSGAFGAGFGRGFWMVLWFYLWYNDMCFIVERQIHKETNSLISTLQKKMNNVGWSLLGFSLSLFV